MKWSVRCDTACARPTTPASIFRVGAAPTRRYGATVAVPHTEALLLRLSPAQLGVAIEAAQQAAGRLKQRSVDHILATLDRVIATWLQPDGEWRRRAEELLPAATGFSREMIRHGLPLLLEPLRGEAVRSLMDRELGDHRILDAVRYGRRAIGPGLIVHVLSGNIPGLAATPIVLSLVLKSAVVIKSAAGDPIFPALFAASVGAIDDELAQCLVVTHWRGGDPAIEEVAFSAADLVVASGSDATIAAIASRVAGRFIGHGHKVSFAVIGRECLNDTEAARDLARRLAFDVSLWDQHGCLSPQLCYIESGAVVTPEQFGNMLVDALAHSARALPPRTLTLDEKAAVLRFRHAAEWHGTRTLLASPESTDWTISIEPDAEFLPSCLNRCIRLKVLPSVTDLAAALAPHRRHLEAVGLALGAERIAATTEVLAASGVRRICPVGRMQTPTLAWQQSGRPRVAEWVEWMTTEGPQGWKTANG